MTAVRLAYISFDAVWGQGVEMKGQCYAIPTMQGSVETIKSYVDEFTAFARQHSERKFLVTRIGCGIAAFTPNEIAPLLLEAIDPKNVILPRDFVEVLTRLQDSTPKSSPTSDEVETIKMWTMCAGNSVQTTR